MWIQFQHDRRLQGSPPPERFTLAESHKPLLLYDVSKEPLCGAGEQNHVQMTEKPRSELMSQQFQDVSSSSGPSHMQKDSAFMSNAPGLVRVTAGAPAGSRFHRFPFPEKAPSGSAAFQEVGNSGGRRSGR